MYLDIKSVIMSAPAKRTKKVKDVQVPQEEEEKVKKTGTKKKEIDAEKKVTKKVKVVYTEDEIPSNAISAISAISANILTKNPLRLPRRNRNVQTATLRDFTYEQVMLQIYQRYRLKK